MIEIKGNLNSAKVFSNDAEQQALDQIKVITDLSIFKGCRLRVMPDVHFGKGAVIGFTSTFNNYVIPNVVGVDIGCGVSGIIFTTSLPLPKDFVEETVIKKIPLGKNHRLTDNLPFQVDLREEIEFAKKMGYDKSVIKQCGTLGGGNHYIEIGKNERNEYVVSVHSGSRHFGLFVAETFQQRAGDYHASLKNKASDYVPPPQGLEYLEKGFGAEEYLEAMGVAQGFASKSRSLMLSILLSALKEKLPDLQVMEKIESTHNYIDLKHKIIRKGAISAQKGERIILPLNQKAGCVIGTGRGIEDWNFSAPHGAGRALGRIKAFGQLSMKEYEHEMEGVYSKSVCPLTLDEAPGAYKDIDKILKALPATMDIESRFHAVYIRKSIEKLNKKAFKKLQENLRQEGWTRPIESPQEDPETAENEI
jgi:tRNA-splicing ligase RtcB (3'-phosphate/5'-hydroxy nucleic acid ligase)